MITQGLGSLYISIASIPIFIIASWWCRKEWLSLGELLIIMMAVIACVSSMVMAIEIVPNSKDYKLNVEQTTVLCMGCFAVCYVTIAEVYKFFSKITKK